MHALRSGYRIYVHGARYGERVTTPGGEVAEILGQLLRRGTRVRLYARLTAGLNPALDEATYPVISGLARSGPQSAAQLAADIGIDRSVVSRHATRLAQAGLIARLPDPSDRRAALLSLTGAGHRAVQDMRQRLAGAFDDYLASWPPGEAARFAVSLRRFTEDGPF
jgi:DNA-binding MarR family transcriptional regulator